MLSTAPRHASMMLVVPRCIWNTHGAMSTQNQPCPDPQGAVGCALSSHSLVFMYGEQEVVGSREVLMIKLRHMMLDAIRVCNTALSTSALPLSCPNSPLTECPPFLVWGQLAYLWHSRPGFKWRLKLCLKSPFGINCFHGQWNHEPKNNGHNHIHLYL